MSMKIILDLKDWSPESTTLLVIACKTHVVIYGLDETNEFKNGETTAIVANMA